MFREFYFENEKIPQHLRLSPSKIKEIVEKKVVRIRNYFKKFSFKKGILGISGGLDSALVAVLAKRALGSENLYLVFLPFFQDNRNGALKKVRKLAENLKLKNKNLLVLSIKKAVNTSWQIVKRFTGGNAKIRKGNIIARERMKILFDLSQAFSALVLGTENKTEYLLGYYTLWGDSASGIEPIKDLWKTEVFQIASRLKEIPKEILCSPPSPQLWKGQTLENELGFSFLEADIVLSAILDLKMKPKEIQKKFNIKKEKIEKILKRFEIGKIKASLPAIL